MGISVAHSSLKSHRKNRGNLCAEGDLKITYVKPFALKLNAMDHALPGAPVKRGPKAPFYDYPLPLKEYRLSELWLSCRKSL